MNWISYCLITIILFSVHDTTLKQLSNAVSSTMASMMINLSAAVVLFIYLWLKPGSFQQTMGEIRLDKNLFFLVLAGVSLGVATLTFMKAFEQGGNLSIAVPMVYTGVMVLCMLAGFLFYKEQIDWKQLAGALLAIGGIYLMSKGQMEG
ncbi:MAG: DMT family transporter [Saprospiraceae bacterium]|nr:DMT family transporter [Saprospiraceae bacterium]